MAINVAELQATVTAETGDFDTKMSSVSDTINRLAGGAALLAGGKAVGDFLGGAIDGAMNLEFQMDAVASALGTVGSEADVLSGKAGITTEQFAQLTDQVQQLGAASIFGPLEVAQAVEEMAKQGFTAEQMTGGLLQSVVELAAATGTDLVPASETLGQVWRAWKDTDPVQLVDELARAANKSSADVTGLASGVAKANAQFQNLGISSTDGIAMMALLNDVGMEGEAAGTSYARMLEDLLVPATQAAVDSQAALGLSFFDANGEFVGQEDMVRQLTTAFADLTTEERTHHMANMLTANGMRALNGILLAGVEGYEEYVGAVKEGTSASDMAAQRVDNLKGSVEEFGETADLAQQNLVSGFLPGLQSLVDVGTGVLSWFNELPPAVHQVIGAVVALGGALMVAAGAFLLWPVLVGPVTAALSGLASVLMGPLGAALALLGLGIAAYTGNWFGFGDAVDKVAGTVGKAIRRIANETKHWLKQGVNPLSAAMAGLAGGIEEIFGDNMVSNWLRDTAEKIHDVATASRLMFDELVDSGLNPLSSAIYVAGRAIDSLFGTNVEEGFRRFAMGIHEGIEAGTAFGEKWNAVAGIIEGVATTIEETWGESGLTDFLHKAALAAGIFGTAYERATNQGLNPFHAALLAATRAIDVMTGGATGLTDWVRQAMTDIQQFIPAFKLLREQAEAMGDSGIAAGIRAFGQALEFATGIDITGLTDGLADFANTVADFGTAVMAGDWDAVGTMVSDALGNIGDALGAAADWVLTIGAPAAIQWAGDVLGTIGAWIQEQLQSLVGEGEEINLGTVAVAIAGYAAEGIQNVWEWLEGQITGRGGGSDYDTQGNYGGGGMAPINLGDIPVTIKNWVIPEGGINLSGLMGQIEQALRVDSGFVESARTAGEAVGREIGVSFANAINTGLDAALSGSGGGGATTSAEQLRGAMAPGQLHLGDAFASFETALTAELKAQAEPAITRAFEAAKQGTLDVVNDQWANFQSDIEDGIKNPGKDPILGEAWDAIGGSQEGWGEVPGTAGLNTFADNIWDGIADWLGDSFTTGQAAEAVPPEIQEQIQAGMAGIGTALGNELGTAMTSTEFTSALETALSGEQATGAFTGVAAAMMDQIIVALEADFKASGETEGSTVGGDIANSLATGIVNGVNDADPTVFDPVGTALMTKLMTSMGRGLAEVAGVDTSGEQIQGGGIANAMINTLALQMTSAVNAASPEAFAPVGAALMTKVQESMASAVGGDGAQTSGEQLAQTMGGQTEGMGASMVSGLASSLAASVSAADPTLFAPIGAALQSQVNNAVMTAMGTGAIGAAEGMPMGGGGDTSGAGLTIATGIINSIASQVALADATPLTAAIQLKISDAVSAMSAGGAGQTAGPFEPLTTGPGANIVTMLVSQINLADWEPLTAAIQLKIQDAITAMSSGEGQAGAPSAPLKTGPGADIVNGLVIQVTNADWSAMTDVFKTKAQEASQGFADGLEAGLQAAGSALQSLQASLTTSFQAIASAAQASGQEAGTAFQTGLDAGLQTAVAAATAAVDAITTGLQAAADAATAAGDAAGTGFSTGLQAGLDAGVAAAQAAASAVTTALQSAADGAYGAGVAVGQGFANGIASMLGAVQDAAASLVAAAQVGIDAAAQLGSPSRLTQRLGQYMGDGFVLGIRDRIKAALGAGRELAEAGAAGIAKPKKEKPIDIGSQLGRDFWRGMLSEVPATIGAARFLVRMAVREADGLAAKLTARSSGHSMLAEFYRAEFEAMDPWSDPKKYINLQRKMYAQLAKARGDRVSATNVQESDARDQLDRAIERGAPRDTIRALRAEHRLLRQLADAQHAAFSARDGSAQAEIAAMKVELLKRKLADLGALDIETDIGKAIADSLREAAEASKLAKEAMKNDMAAVAGSAEHTGNKIGSSISEGAGVAQQAIQEAMGTIGDALGTGTQTGQTAGTNMMGGVADGISQGAPNVQSTIDDIWQQATGGATDDGRQVGQDFTAGLGTSLPNAADLAQRIMDQIASSFEGTGQIGTSAGRELGTGFATGLDSSNAPQTADHLVNLTERAILTGGSDAAQAANDAGLDIGNSLSTGISRSGGDAIRTSNQVNNRISNTLSGAFSKVNLGKVNTSGVVNAVQSTLNSLGNINASGTGTGIGSDLGQGIISGVRDKTSGIREQVTTAIESAGSVNTTSGTTIGNAFGTGMAQGVTQKGEMINIAVQKAVDEAFKKGMDAAKAKSPSRLFATMGQSFSTGIAMGIDQDASTVTGAMSDLVKDTAAEARKFDGTLGRIGFAGDPEANGAGSRRSEPVIVHQTVQMHGDNYFDSKTDWDTVFRARGNEAAIANAR